MQSTNKPKRPKTAVHTGSGGSGIFLPLSLLPILLSLSLYPSLVYLSKYAFPFPILSQFPCSSPFIPSFSFFFYSAVFLLTLREFNPVIGSLCSLCLGGISVICWSRETWQVATYTTVLYGPKCFEICDFLLQRTTWKAFFLKGQRGSWFNPLP